MKIKIKHPLKKNLTKDNIKQIRILENKNLELLIKLKYKNIIDKYGQATNIKIINGLFKTTALSKILDILSI